MSKQEISELVRPLIAQALCMGRLQDFLECFPDPSERKQWIMECWQGGVITDEQTKLLIEHNGLEAN